MRKLHIRPIPGRSHYQATHPAKAINADFQCHVHIQIICVLEAIGAMNYDSCKRIASFIREIAMPLPEPNGMT